MQSIAVSDIVLSLAGHDAGKTYVVVELEVGYARLSDGKVRRLCNTKRKKLKHIEKAKQSGSPFADKIRSGIISDSEIRKVLAIYRSMAKD